MAHRRHDAIISTPHQVSGSEITVSASYGTASIPPCESAAELVEAADGQLDRHKRGKPATHPVPAFAEITDR